MFCQSFFSFCPFSCFFNCTVVTEDTALPLPFFAAAEIPLPVAHMDMFLTIFPSLLAPRRSICLYGFNSQLKRLFHPEGASSEVIGRSQNEPLASPSGLGTPTKSAVLLSPNSLSVSRMCLILGVLNKWFVYVSIMMEFIHGQLGLSQCSQKQLR